MHRAFAAAPVVPTVDFYGDAAQWSTSALLHSEPLIERSSLHGWRIRPHRHSSLAQLFWLERGTGVGRFDGERFELTSPCVVVVPERCVHEFEWREGSDGYALSVASALVQDLHRQIGAPARILEAPDVLAAGDEQRFLSALFTSIQHEYIRSRPLKEALLESLMKALAVWIARHRTPARRAEIPSRGAMHYERFLAMREQHHRSSWTVADFARALGITAAHLNAICREKSGQSALHLIHERVVLSARRELAYTDKSIADVAASLGFSEPSYFTRFFKRKMGMTPKQYRRQSGTHAG